MPYDIGSCTDVGRRRSNNEDAFAVVPLANGALCVVADGMGGHQAGEVASQLAVETIAQRFPRAGGDAATLVEVVQAANRTILAAAADPARRGMGTTVVCALLVGPRALLANVGDSPAFLVRPDQAHQVTRDHSVVGEAVAEGALTPQQAATHPYRHVLTRCLGLEEPLAVDTYPPLDLQPGQALVLCSDGLTEHVRSDELPTALAGQSAQAAAEALVRLANQRGGADNTTVIVARWMADG